MVCVGASLLVGWPRLAVTIEAVPGALGSEASLLVGKAMVLNIL